jgi:hypothetical protein
MRAALGVGVMFPKIYLAGAISSRSSHRWFGPTQLKIVTTKPSVQSRRKGVQGRPAL